MGLFSMIGDVVSTLHDMKELSKIQEVIEQAVEGLIASGKCPDELKKVFEATRNVSKDASQAESLKLMKDFAAALTANVNLLPQDISEKIEKYSKVVKDLEKNVTDLAKQTGQK